MWCRITALVIVNCLLYGSGLGQPPYSKIDSLVHSDDRILVSADAKNDMVELSIADTGIGMDQNVMDKIFRLDESFTTKGTANEMGNGLGLILCKEFVEKNGGQIWVNSTEGEGSTFYFILHTNEWS